MRFIFTIVILTNFLVVFAQHDFINASELLADSTEFKFAMNLYADGFVNSNSVSNAVINKAYRGASLEGDLKSNIFDRLKDENRLVFDLYAGGNGFFFLNDKSIMFSVGYETRNYTASSFPADLVSLALNGNEPYEGDTMHLGGFTYQNQRYESFKFGAIKRFDKLGINLGGNLGLVRGTSFQEVNIEKGEFYTAPDGEEITIDLEATIIQPSSKSNLGASIDFFIDKNLKNGGTLSFKLNDLGFVSWSNLTEFAANDTYEYTGVEIDDLFALDTSAFNDLKGKNSTQEVLGLAEKKIKTSELLPAIMRLHYQHQFSKRFNLTVGGLYRVSTGSLPALDLEADYKLPFGLTVLGELDFGGYGWLNYAFGAKVNLLKDRMFVLGKFYLLESLVAAQNTSGEGASVYVHYIF